MAELPRQFEANRNADQHSEPGLLGKQCPHRPEALLRIVRAGGGPNRLLVREIEPAALGERLGEHPLERRSRLSDEILRFPQALRVGDRFDGGIELGVGEGAVRH